MDKKITSVDFAKSDQFAAALEGYKRNIEKMPQLMALVARERRIKYDAYIAAGFQPEQALILCQH